MQPQPYRDSDRTVFLNRSAVLEKTVGQVTQGDRSWPRRSISVCFTVKGLRGLARYAAGSYGVNIQEEDTARIRALFFAR